MVYPQCMVAALENVLRLVTALTPEEQEHIARVLEEELCLLEADRQFDALVARRPRILEQLVEEAREDVAHGRVYDSIDGA